MKLSVQILNNHILFLNISKCEIEILCQDEKHQKYVYFKLIIYFFPLRESDKKKQIKKLTQTHGKWVSRRVNSGTLSTSAGSVLRIYARP